MLFLKDLFFLTFSLDRNNIGCPLFRDLTHLYANVAGAVFFANELQDLDLGEQVKPVLSSTLGAMAVTIPGFQLAASILVNSVLAGVANAFLTLPVPDVLWGQLYKTQRALRKLAELSDFKVLRDAVWSDEKTLNVFILEFEQRFLPPVKKHLGPPLEREKECENFLSKYVNNPDVVSGPYISEGRWVVELQPKGHGRC